MRWFILLLFQRRNRIRIQLNGVFLMTGVMTAVAAPKILAQIKETTATLGGKRHIRRESITPPGSVSLEHFQAHCTSCHLCVSKCPSHVLKPLMNMVWRE